MSSSSNVVVVAALLVEYAIARNVNTAPKNSVVYCVPLPRRSGLHVLWSWFPTADMMRYVQYAATMLDCARPDRGLYSCTVG